MRDAVIAHGVIRGWPGSASGDWPVATPSADMASTPFRSRRGRHIRRKLSWNAGFFSQSFSRWPCCTPTRRFLAPPDTTKPVAAQQSQQPQSQNASQPDRHPRRRLIARRRGTRSDVSDTSEREIVVETADVEAVLTNHGGAVTHWRLKHYVDSEGKPVDLVPSGLPAISRRPSRFVRRPQLTSRINNALFHVSEGARVDATSMAKRWCSSIRTQTGVRVRKEFVFEPRDLPGHVFRVRDAGRSRLATRGGVGPGLGDAGAAAGGGSFFTGTTSSAPGDLSPGREGGSSGVKRGGQEPAHESSFRLPASTITISSPPRSTRENPRRLRDAVGAGSATTRSASSWFPRSGLRKALGVKFFVGPNSSTRCGVSTPNWCARSTSASSRGCGPLLGVLKWLYGFIGNYGWSIIVLTILINLLMFPLRHKSVVSMRKMQAIHHRSRPSRIATRI
jgi:YidC/Oxa1 family membrane protein insertase